MSLFVINRYGGEQVDPAKDEKNHLSELLKRIEERKQQRAAQSHIAAPEKDDQATEEPQEKKRKKKRDADETDVNRTENNVSQSIPNEEQKSGKKKKRKKLTQSQDGSQTKLGEPENEGELFEKFNTKDQENHALETNTPSNSSGMLLPDQENGYTILGSKSKKKKREVKRILPDWLAHPEIVSTDLGSGPSLEALEENLDSKLIEILRTNGMSRLFPVQASMISWLSKCNRDREQGWWTRDTCVSAPTGSGKTLAYVLPIIQHLQSRLVPKVRCLIVVPVQELAAQVYKVLTAYTSHTSLRVAVLSGASSFEQEQSNIVKKTFRGEYISGVDIVVATPGRLVDHILKTPGFSLSDLKFIVIDEADRSADWLQYLPEPHYRGPRLTLQNMRCSPMPAQKLLFSATLSQDPEKLSRLGLFQPILFTSIVVSDQDGDVNLDKEIGDFVGRYTSPEELTELAVECTAAYKPVAVYDLLTKNDKVSKTLVFTNSGQMAHRLALLLQSFLSDKSIVVGELSAQLAPKQRESVLSKFAEGEIHVLISSDALARGVDVPNVQLVISYDLPKHIKGYVHRAGRTGRAGKSGTSVSVLTSNQVGLYRHMLGNAHKTVPNIEKLDLVPMADAINYQNHVDKLKDILEKEKEESLQRTKNVKRSQKNVSK